MQPQARKLWAQARELRIEADVITDQAEKKRLIRRALELEDQAEQVEESGGSETR